MTAQWGRQLLNFWQTFTTANPFPVSSQGTDSRPAPVAITTADLVCATATGFDGGSVITGTPTAASFATFAINGQSSLGLLISNTFTGTLQFEVSYDGGTTYYPMGMRVRSTNYVASSTTGKGHFSGDVSSATHFRVRATAAMTGTATVTPAFSQASGQVQVVNPMVPVLTAFIETTPATLTRPANATPYTANDAVTDTGGTAITVTVSGTNDFPVSLEAMTIGTTDTGPGTATATFEAYIYDGTITPATDNAAFTFNQANLVGIMSGSFKLAADGSFARLIPSTGSRIIRKPISGAKTFNVILKTLTAFTSSANSTVLNVVVEGFQGRA